MLLHLAAAKLIDLGHQPIQEFTVVTDDDGRAVESPDGLLQHILRSHIQMIGRLVENQQVDRLQQQTDDGQTAAFASAEHFHTLVTLLASKHEGTQNVVDAQSDFTLRHMVDGLKHGEALVQLLSLVLCEIAYLHIMANLEVAVKGNLAHDTLHQGRFALTVLADKGHLLATLDGQVNMVENHMSIFLPHLVADDGIVTRAQTGRELQVHGGIVHLVNLDRNNLLQLLDFLLNLHSLRGLIAETLNEVLHLSHLLLLVFVCPQLLFTAFLTQHDILVVLHLVVDDAATRYFQRAVRHIVDKGTVVTDQHHSTCRLGKELLQPLDGFYVEMVRRLVKQQHVGTLQQNLGQLNTHTPTS